MRNALSRASERGSGQAALSVAAKRSPRLIAALGVLTTAFINTSTVMEVDEPAKRALGMIEAPRLCDS